jgi:hypothetical protein
VVAVVTNTETGVR